MEFGSETPKENIEAFLFMEIWKEIVGYEGLYMVSNKGRIKSLRNGLEKLLYLNNTPRGYLVTVLFKNKIKKTHNVHKLVAIAFLNHKPNGSKLVVNHKDFDKKNNNLENLEIVTQRENANQKHIISSSKFVGVSFEKGINKYVASIFLNRKKIYLGSFVCEEEASKYYQDALFSIENNLEIKKITKKNNKK